MTPLFKKYLIELTELIENEPFKQLTFYRRKLGINDKILKELITELSNQGKIDIVSKDDLFNMFKPETMHTERHYTIKKALGKTPTGHSKIIIPKNRDIKNLLGLFSEKVK